MKKVYSPLCSRNYLTVRAGVLGTDFLGMSELFRTWSPQTSLYTFSANAEIMWKRGRGSREGEMSGAPRPRWLHEPEGMILASEPLLEVARDRAVT